MKTTFGNLLKELIDSGIEEEEARAELRVLSSEFEEEELVLAVNKRIEGIPSAYIIGHKDFYKDRFYVKEGVLIPRSDTELLVEAGLRFLGVLEYPYGDLNLIMPFSRSSCVDVLDLCTGSGIVGIEIYKELILKNRECNAILIDISPDALEVASRNSEELTDGKVLVSRESVLDLMDEGATYDKSFDLIVGNPPYIEDDVILTLSELVREYEPRIALSGGKDGLDFYMAILEKYVKKLKKGGAIILEHGWNQGRSVRQMFEEQGLTKINTLRDYGNNDRVTIGVRI